MNKKIRVLIVDDSAVVREKLREILSSDPEIEVMGVASDPYIAVKKIEDEVPDVITLDIEMPNMDGLTFLKKIMSQHPIPVVICSSIAEEQSENFFKATAYGAVEIVHKPRLGTRQFLEEARIQICDVVKAASLAKIGKLPEKTLRVDPKLSADAMLQKSKKVATLETTEKVIVIGTSTGGTEALRYLLPQFPLGCSGIVIVQHMPENFTKSFAKSLNEVCQIEVKEAENQDSVLRGRALIAPGNKHLMLKRSGARYHVEVRDGPFVNRHRPSVDVLFRSAARYAGSNAVGVIMTGMGDDGARGLLELKEAGAKTIAQDEASCIVFGMPRVAIELGGADKIIPLSRITEEVLRFAK